MHRRAAGSLRRGAPLDRAALQPFSGGPRARSGGPAPAAAAPVAVPNLRELR